ncbi:type IV pilus twitching motility protein PilT [Natronincola ferrireducens]|uniref:Twitching motility protein PilT n=1 Tax=Natronincola ferrireducens TaxID=393762 RepID=A0A1G9CLS5_9FIRM|nr:type IV pilus twitching motility protein PilT [Natronincola ferrireducens]SDK52578.1 twitching motility protein PilT [Natronincola ferrireducens]
MDIFELLDKTLQLKASDLHITVAVPPTIRLNGRLVAMGETRLSPEDTEKLSKQILTEKQQNLLDEKGELDLSYSTQGRGRFRVNAYKQRGSYSIAMRVVHSQIPSMEELGLPPVLKDLSRKNRGLILVTGPTGSGKSTTLASMLDLINAERKCHILTLEDPIEYLHKHNKSIINQREIGADTFSFANGLRSALRQDPDVILVGEMRDLETIAIAITAAETGHLVLSTLHTLGAAKTIDRIIDVFPPYQQQQIRIQLASVLEGIVSQQLMAKKDESGRVAAFEVMVANNAIRNLVREGKTHQIQTSIQTGMKFGMQTMDSCLIDLYKRLIISKETALQYALDIDYVKKQLVF